MIVALGLLVQILTPVVIWKVIYRHAKIVKLLLISEALTMLLAMCGLI